MSLALTTDVNRSVASRWSVAIPRGLGAAGALIIAGYALVAVLAPYLAPYSPAAFSGSPLEWPSGRHWLGTNDVGQDILSQLIFGARVSLLVALLSASSSLIVAALVGTVAGYLRSWPEIVLMRLIDVLLAIPQLPLMILLAAYLPPSLATVVLVIALLAWPIPARVVRAQTLSVRQRGYVSAARLFGGRAPYVIGRHLVPALAPILAATFVSLAGRAVLLEAGLAFLGLGDPLTRSWGAVMRDALNYNGIFFTPHWAWWLLPAGINVSLVVFALTLVGMHFEHRLDPRLARHD